MGVRSFLRKYANTIKVIKIVIASLLGAMVVIDIVLVQLDDLGFPTFSEVIRDKRTQLIWLNFLLSGLIAKVFYNRKVTTKRREISGFFTFLAIIILLFALGKFITTEIGTPYQLLIMVCGGILAHRVWPQYIHDEDAA